MTAPPGRPRHHQQEAQASAGYGISRQARRRAVTAIGLMNRVSFSEARAIYAEAVVPVLRSMTPAEIDAYLRDTYRIDPTGVTAVRNVTRERGH